MAIVVRVTYCFVDLTHALMEAPALRVWEQQQCVTVPKDLTVISVKLIYLFVKLTYASMEAHALRALELSQVATVL